MKKALILTICLHIFMQGIAQWSSNPAVNTPICKAIKYQNEVRVISDGKGGAIGTWIDHRFDTTPDSSNGDIYVQRIDKDGYVQWSIDGLGVCVDPGDQRSVNIVPDGAGGAIIIWRDQRAGDNDIYAQRIDSTGIPKWAANGVVVCNGPSNQRGAKAVSDGFGGAIVSWESKDTAGGADWVIRVQKLTSTGARSWATVGVLISYGFSEDEFNARIETDGQGGAIITWELEVDTANTDIYAQRVTASGAEIWNAGNPLAVVVAPGRQVGPKIEPDGSNGAIIVWMDSVLVGNNNIYAQRINSGGSKPWGNNPIVVCNNPSNQTAIDVSSEGINGVMIAWKDWRNVNRDIYGQALDMNGVVQWIPNGKPIVNSTADEGNPNLFGDGFGNVICVYQDSMIGVGGSRGNIAAQKMDMTGNLLWGSGVPISTAPNQQTQPKHVPDGTGGAICFFMDKRDSALTNFDIYAQRILSNGSLGIHEESNFAESTCFPNPFSNTAAIRLVDRSRPVSNLSIRVINILGEEMTADVNRYSDGFIIHKSNLPNGIYFYGIVSKSSIISSGKFIITD